MPSKKRYPVELRDRAVRMFVEVREQHESASAFFAAEIDRPSR
ncbi:hypothetical protein ACLMAL_37305 [Nocardia sp. CWNU-33]